MANFGNFNEITTAVDSLIIRVLQRQALVGRSPLCQVLDSMAGVVTGATGPGIGITDALGLPEAHHYDGFDAGVNFDIAPGPVTHYANWSHISAPVAISGPELHAANGLTTEDVLMNQRSMNSLDKTEANQFYNLLGKRFEDMGDRLTSVSSTDLWGTTNAIAERRLEQAGGQRTQSRLPMGIDAIFDLEQNVHGLDIDGLGKWDEYHPWRDGAPGDGLTSEQQMYVHCPRIYDNDGTTRQLSKAIVEDPLNEMAWIGGDYICAVHPSLYGPLQREFDGDDQGPVLIGYDKFEQRITCVQYQNCIFFTDPHAPKDRIRLIHIGMGMGTERRDPGFQIVNWMPKRQFVGYRNLIRHQEKLRNRAVRGLRFGYSDAIPYYRDEFSRIHSFEDAVGMRVRRRWSQVCFHRWKHIEIRDLRA